MPAPAVSSAGVVAATDHLLRFMAEIPPGRRKEFIFSINAIVTACFEDAQLYQAQTVATALANATAEAACED